MVRAILSGRTTQTRRIVKPQPTSDGYWWSHKGYSANGENIFRDGMPFFGKCPYGRIGDRLWVRETWCMYPMAGNDGDAGLIYRATNDCIPPSMWKPSIHMRRIDSRITLELIRVGVERLNEISEADAYSEGVTILPEHQFSSGGNQELRNEARTAFAKLWSTIHAADDPNGWAENPWVWVLQFKRLTI